MVRIHLATIVAVIDLVTAQQIGTIPEVHPKLQNMEMYQSAWVQETSYLGCS